MFGELLTKILLLGGQEIKLEKKEREISLISFSSLLSHTFYLDFLEHFKAGEMENIWKFFQALADKIKKYHQREIPIFNNYLDLLRKEIPEIGPGLEREKIYIFIYLVYKDLDDGSNWAHWQPFFNWLNLRYQRKWSPEENSLWFSQAIIRDIKSISAFNLATPWIKKLVEKKIIALINYKINGQKNSSPRVKLLGFLEGPSEIARPPCSWIYSNTDISSSWK